MKTSELTGRALDRMVAKCEGYPVEMSKTGFLIFADPLIQCGPRGSVYSPSTNWAQGGLIIERARIAVVPVDNYSQFSWIAAGNEAMLEVFPYEGSTALEAAMRCYVGAQFGDEIPEELK